jgi:O-antigen/teichoic acid export membrane protein
VSNKKISFGVVVGGASLAVDSLSGLIIFPLLLNFCTKEIAGLWLFYTSFAVILGLGQAGLAPVVMRKASEVFNVGSDKEIANFKALIRKGYWVITIIVIAISVILYFSYIYWVLIDHPDILIEGTVAWAFFSLGNILRMHFIKNIHLINGIGEVGWDKLLNIVLSIIRLGGYFLILKLGGELVGLSFIYFVVTVLYGIGSLFLLNKFIPKNLLFSLGVSSRAELISLFKLSGKVLILNLVGIIVMKKDIYIVQAFMGLDIIPSFVALSRIQSLIYSVSVLIPQMIFPFISKNYYSKNYNKVFKLYFKSVVLALVAALILSIVLLATGNWVIPLWLGKGNYLGNTIFGLILIFGLIVIHHNAHASAIISTGANYFTWPAIINAILSIPFSIIGMKYYGIEGLLIGNIIATILPSIYVVNFSVRFFRRLTKINVSEVGIIDV